MVARGVALAVGETCGLEWIVDCLMDVDQCSVDSNEWFLFVDFIGAFMVFSYCF